MTVGELKDLLKQFDDNTPIAVFQSTFPLMIETNKKYTLTQDVDLSEEYNLDTRTVYINVK